MFVLLKGKSDQLPALSIVALGLMLASLLSISCTGPISWQASPTPPPSHPMKPEDYLSLLPLLKELPTSQSGGARLQQDLADLSAALAALCGGAPQEAEEKMQRLMENSGSELLRSQVFSLLMWSYQHRGAWPEMQRLVEGQGERIKSLYSEDIAQWAQLATEGVEAPGQKTVLPLIMKNGLPFLSVSINGKQGDFLIDTGASKSMIIASFAAACGVFPLSFKTVKTPAYLIQKNKAGRAVLSELRMGPISISHHPVLVMNSLLYSFNIPKIDGILGWNALRHFRLEIDFKGDTISFSRPAEENVRSRNFFWLGYPLVRLQTESGQDVFLELDTGAHRTLFNDNLEKRGVLKIEGDKIIDPWGPVEKGGFSYLWPASRLDLVLDGFLLKFQKPYLKKNLQISDQVRIDGLLGCDVLRLGTFIIDEPNGFFGFRAN